MKNKRFKIIYTLALSLVLLTAGCSASAEGSDSVTSSNSDIISGETLTRVDDSETVEKADIDASLYALSTSDTDDSWDSKEQTLITLGSEDVLIDSAGVYVLQGILEDGQVIVDTEDDQRVQLVLNGVYIKNLDSAAIYIKNANTTVITLAEGTINTIIDGETYVFDDEETDEPSAAIFSKDDLTINGSGTLKISANYNDAIVSKDDLIIANGNIEIDAIDDGLVGKDKVVISAGTIMIESEGDGIKSTNDSDLEKGFVAITGGDITIATQADGLQAETDIIVLDGRITVNSGDDAFNSNNSIEIDGGNIEITSGDDGIHADTAIEITNGNILIIKSYEGIESALIQISGGEIDITSSDDGINISGGNDNSSVGGRPGEGSFNSTSDDKLVISGGIIDIDADGDGLDSNGSIYMSGGYVMVSGPTNSGNGSIDYDQTFEMTGGILIASGSSGMMQAPSNGSTQNVIAMTFSNTINEGSTVKLIDELGNVLIAYDVTKNIQSIIMSMPEMELGINYTIQLDGEEVVTFQPTSIITYVNESGITDGIRGNGTGGGFGGGNKGGNRNQPPVNNN